MFAYESLLIIANCNALAAGAQSKFCLCINNYSSQGLGSIFTRLVVLFTPFISEYRVIRVIGGIDACDRSQLFEDPRETYEFSDPIERF